MLTNQVLSTQLSGSTFSNFIMKQWHWNSGLVTALGKYSCKLNSIALEAYETGLEYQVLHKNMVSGFPSCEESGLLRHNYQFSRDELFQQLVFNNSIAKI